MKLKNEKLWNDIKSRNSDSYGAIIVRLSERWADLMEQETPEGKPLTQEIMQSTKHKADTEHASGAAYGAAVATLSECWYRGEELRILHNARFGVTSTEEGVVDPSIMLVSKR